MKSKRYSKHFPLPERIGTPDLFIGRDQELAIMHKWINKIPRQRALSRAILARKKSGKTAIMQRLFNQLWSAGDGGDDNPWEMEIIPFYLEITDQKRWLPDFALEYYQTFASHYISYLERNPKLVKTLLSWEKIKAYGEKNNISVFIDDVNFLIGANKHRDGDSMWIRAYKAPHRFAALYERPVVVMLDEFQNINHYIYLDEAKTNRDESLAGSYHEHAESKIAPMLVTGSYVGWLIAVINEYLEGGRLRQWTFPPYLSEEEGLEAVYKYANTAQEPITPATAISINRLCLSDPFFISCVIESEYLDKDLTTEQGVIDTVYHELSDRNAEMARTWEEYINLSVDRINDVHGKSLVLYLCKYPDRDWTHLELKEALKLDLHPHEIHKRLVELSKADLINRGNSNIQFRGLKDGTLYLIFKNRFEHEINAVSVDLRDEFREKNETLKKENRSLRGKLNYLSGKMAEELFATELRTRKRFAISVYFSGLGHLGETASVPLNVVDVRSRVIVQRADKKNMELDVVAKSSDNRTLVVEIKNQQSLSTRSMVEDFWEKVLVYTALYPQQSILPAFLSLGGFHDDALTFCKEKGVGTATEIAYLQTEW